MTPLQKLIFDALTFAEIAAGEGVYFSKTHNRPEIDPAEFLYAYSKTTGDEDWETFALRISTRVASLETIERRIKSNEERIERMTKMREDVDELKDFILDKRLNR